MPVNAPVFFSLVAVMSIIKMIGLYRSYGSGDHSITEWDDRLDWEDCPRADM